MTYIEGGTVHLSVPLHGMYACEHHVSAAFDCPECTPTPGTIATTQLQTMIDQLRELRRPVEPKRATNPRYHRISVAISALLWLQAELLLEERINPDEFEVER